jgi:hypothetical protein
MTNSDQSCSTHSALSSRKLIKATQPTKLD